MTDIRTNYLGLDLKTPILIGASPLTASPEAIAKCAEAGAGAVVLKSLFEEQVRMDNRDVDEALAQEEEWHAEVFDYMQADLGIRYGARQYLELLRRSKQKVDIPVIASLNAESTSSWYQFAKDIEATGADALELNIALMARDVITDASTIESRYEEIVRRVTEVVSIPVCIKLVPYFSALPYSITRLTAQGARGFVLFNRLYRPAIDTESMAVCTDNNNKFSSRKELSPSLRTISCVAGRVNATFAAATGVHEADDVIASLLTGADAVQMVTAPYTKGVDRCIPDCIAGLKKWMDEHGFDSVSAFKGRLSEANSDEGEVFGRTQYIKSIAVPDKA